MSNVFDSKKMKYIHQASSPEWLLCKSKYMSVEHHFEATFCGKYNVSCP